MDFSLRGDPFDFDVSWKNRGKRDALDSTNESLCGGCVFQEHCVLFFYFEYIRTIKGALPIYVSEGSSTYVERWVD